MADKIEGSSELSRIARLNGNFRRNYGPLLGAFLYLRSISAARRTSSGAGLRVAVGTVVLTWVAKLMCFWSGRS